MMTLVAIACLVAGPAIAGLVLIRAIRHPDPDDFLDKPDHWGAI